jgi:hypothetical protein
MGQDSLSGLVLDEGIDKPFPFILTYHRSWTIQWSIDQRHHFRLHPLH